MGALARPRLFEDRPCYRLVDLTAIGDRARLTLSLGTYFDVVLRQVAGALGYAWLFVPAVEFRSAGGFGNALLIRGQVRAVQQWQLLTPRIYDGSEPSEQRAVVLANVSINGVACWAGSTHFPKQESDERASAARRLLELAGRVDGPWVICGDFNQPAADWLPADLAMAPDPPAPTYPAQRPAEAIDYCIADGLSLTGRAKKSAGSDHLPILVTATPCGDGAEPPEQRTG